MDLLKRVARAWLSQDVALRNAGQASVRMQHRRRELDDVEAFLAAHHHDPAWQATASALFCDTEDVRRPRQVTL
jgi:hypothetical protein